MGELAGEPVEELAGEPVEELAGEPVEVRCGGGGESLSMSLLVASPLVPCVTCS